MGRVCKGLGGGGGGCAEENVRTSSFSSLAMGANRYDAATPPCSIRAHTAALAVTLQRARAVCPYLPASARGHQCGALVRSVRVCTQIQKREGRCGLASLDCCMQGRIAIRADSINGGTALDKRLYNQSYRCRGFDEDKEVSIDAH
jgi:hypothetical protein